LHRPRTEGDYRQMMAKKAALREQVGRSTVKYWRCGCIVEHIYDPTQPRNIRYDWRRRCSQHNILGGKG